MRARTVLASMMIATLALVSLPAMASDGEETSVKGEILDLACYISRDGHGPDHAKCAEKCVKGGQPMGLLAKDGTVYVLFADHGDASSFEKAKDYAGKKVEVTGSLTERGGVKGITVQGVKAI